MKKDLALFKEIKAEVPVRFGDLSTSQKEAVLYHLNEGGLPSDCVITQVTIRKYSKTPRGVSLFIEFPRIDEENL